MKSTDDRKLFGTPIGASAASGNIATIPQTQTTEGDGTASVALGFPPETFIARAAGGEPPRGQDMNGLLNLLSSAIRVLQAGYLGAFDAGFAQSIGGYPAGAIVAGSVPGAFWVSTVDANVSTPGASGATWQSLFNGYATQAWAQGLFATLAQLAAETSRATTAEAAKANLTGGNALLGAQSIVGDVNVTQGHLIRSYVPQNDSDPNAYMRLNAYTDTTVNLLTGLLELVGSSGSIEANWGFRSSGRVTGSAGTLALVSELLMDPSIKCQVFSASCINGTTVTFPSAFSSASGVLVIPTPVGVGGTGSPDNIYVANIRQMSVTASNFSINLRTLNDGGSSWESAPILVTFAAFGPK